MEDVANLMQWEAQSKVYFYTVQYRKTGLMPQSLADTCECSCCWTELKALTQGRDKMAAN
jgi:hypothetical protein